jgi:predicted permease
VAVTGGSWLVATFGTVNGARTRLAVGGGTCGNGTTIPLPDTGFTLANIAAEGAALASVSTTVGNSLDNIAVSLAAGVVSVTASDNSGHNYTPTASWWAVLSQTGY